MEYGCIGEHLSHSFSKEIHARIAPYSYELREINRESLHNFLTMREFKGINVTIPYKEAVIPYLDEISPEARSIGAVNTVVNRGGKLYGYNTDFFGMQMLIEQAGISLKGKKAVILGTGGTSKTAAEVARSLGASEILKVSRSGGGGAITYSELYKNHTDTEILIHTTPVGMFPNGDAVPVEIEAFPALSGVVDVVYHPLRTRLISEAKKRGIPSAAGLYMLVAQAVRASEIFTDSVIAPDQIAEVYRGIVSLKENVVLIGMPGCGKTTVGKLLAEKTGRRFLDTDALIEEGTHLPISDLFDRYGESGFREIESRVIREQVAPLTGCIVATGGGAVLSEENVRVLKQNGTLLLLDRPLNLLTPTASRPTAFSKEAMKARFHERDSIYRHVADSVFDAASSPEEIASMIIKEQNL